MNKIKKAARVLLIGAMSLAASASSQAALIDRGSGLIYDNVLNVTWMQDVALSGTQGGSGIFNWSGAQAWAQAVGVRRLSTIGACPRSVLSTAPHSIEFSTAMDRLITDMASQLPGGASAGFTGNELAYMYHVNLGNTSRCTGEGPFLPGKVFGDDVGVRESKLRGCARRARRYPFSTCRA